MYSLVHVLYSYIFFRSHSLRMPDNVDKTADYPVGPDGKKLKPCCACPETKRPRDECIMEKVNRRKNNNNCMLDL